MHIIYLPNFYYGNYSDTNIKYYSNDEFSQWQESNEQYVMDAKNYLFKISNEINNKVTMKQLTNNTLMNWDMFETNYWMSENSLNNSKSLFNKLSIDSFHAINSYNMVLYPNRRCQNEDLSIYYRDDINKNIPPPFCNVTHYKIKPRTNKFPTQTLNSLFPIQTRSRMEALSMSQTAYFVSIIIVQWADLMICKTRIRSLFEQGMTNTFMNYALIFETFLGAVLIYIPIANEMLGTRPLKFTFWTAAVPFSILIYIYDEIRKGWIRKNNNGWIEKNTFW